MASGELKNLAGFFIASCKFMLDIPDPRYRALPAMIRWRPPTDAGPGSRQRGGAMAKPAIAEKTYPLVGIFDSGDAAERAYQACLDRGYELGQVNVLVSEETRAKLLKSDHEMKAELGKREAEGGELGGPKGGRVGFW